MAIIPWATVRVERLVGAYPKLYSLLRVYYRRLVEQEVNLGAISGDDSVLCIGAGPCPVTAVEIAVRSGATVVAVDNDSQAVASARKVIQALGMAERVKVELADGRAIDAEDYSVVHIAGQVQPRERVLHTVLQRLNPGARVLVRCPHQRLHRLYSSSESSHLYSASSRQMNHRGSLMKGTLLFVKEWGRELDEKTSADRQRSPVGGTASMGWATRGLEQSAGD